MAKNRVIKAARSAEELVAKARARASMQATSAPADWAEPQAEALREALQAQEREGTLGYCELAGFLFAVACAPELVKPSEWIPEVLGERPDGFGSLEDAQRVMNLVMGLHNHINRGVLERRPSLPAGIAVHDDPMQNFGPGAPLGQWARGYFGGRLCFFASREFAESVVRGVVAAQAARAGCAKDARDAARCDARELAMLGRGIEDARQGR